MTGEYTDIVEVDAPGQAVVGSRVDIVVRVKNIYSSVMGVMFHAVLEYGVSPPPPVSYSYNSANLNPGGIHSFNAWFTMPDKDVTIRAYSYFYGSDKVWHSDDEKTADISVAEAFEGTISRKELEYDGDQDSVPVYSIPQGERGLVHIWGRNDMATYQKMGIWWQVKDPDGVVVEEYADWETATTGPGNAQHFIGGRFDLDKPGTYTVAVQLVMNPYDQVVVDDYYGTLCTVEAAVPESEFSQFSIADYKTV